MKDEMNDTQIQQIIRKLNDNLRTSLNPALGRLMMSRLVSKLGELQRMQLLRMVSKFEDFTPDTDPYLEHDFGTVTLGGVKYLWKIDYYDLGCQYGSEDPSDPSMTTRVLTVMEAGEY